MIRCLVAAGPAEGLAPPRVVSPPPTKWRSRVSRRSRAVRAKSSPPASRTYAQLLEFYANSGESDAVIQGGKDFLTNFPKAPQRTAVALLLSTLDWALIETWKDAGIPLAAVLRGIVGRSMATRRIASSSNE